MSFIIVITWIYQLINNNFLGSLFLFTHIYIYIEFTLRGYLVVASEYLAGDCSQLKVTVMNSGRCHEYL